MFAQVPAFDTVHNKLVSFVDGVPSLPNSNKIKDDLAQEIFPWLKQRYVEKLKAPTSPAVVAAFGRTIAALVADLPPAYIFPLFDVWRLAILEPTIAHVYRLERTGGHLSAGPLQRVQESCARNEQCKERRAG